MSKPRCTTAKPARCIIDGRRTLAHVCTHFPGHQAPHRCECGHRWTDTPPPNTTPSHTGSARRRYWKDTP